MSRVGREGSGGGGYAAVREMSAKGRLREERQATRSRRQNAESPTKEIDYSRTEVAERSDVSDRGRGKTKLGL